MSNLMNKAKDMLRKDKSDNTYNNDPNYNNNPNVGGGYGNQGMNDPNVGGGYNNQGMGNQGMGNQGMGNQGMGNQGMGNQGMGNQGAGNQGMGQGMGSDASYNNPNVGGGYGQSQGMGNDSRFGNDSGFGNNNPNTTGYDQQGNSGSTTAGPHNSNLANKMDPRVDSDRDHRNDPTSTYGSNTSGGEYTSSTNTGSTNAGPHSSNMANKMDPRFDSDMDNRNDPTSRVGGYGQQDNYGASGANPAASGNYNDNSGFNQGGTGLAAQSRVDDQAMYQGNQQGMHEGHHKHHHHHQGQQQGAGFNQNTPAYDQTTGQGYGGDNNNSSYTPGSGDANKTAGPHNSNMMNKLDPRVDSDMDGSKTYGGNKTHY